VAVYSPERKERGTEAGTTGAWGKEGKATNSIKESSKKSAAVSEKKVYLWGKGGK